MTILVSSHAQSGETTDWDIEGASEIGPDLCSIEGISIGSRAADIQTALRNIDLEASIEVEESDDSQRVASLEFKGMHITLKGDSVDSIVSERNDTSLGDRVRPGSTVVDALEALGSTVEVLQGDRLILVYKCRNTDGSTAAHVVIEAISEHVVSISVVSS